MQFKRYDCYGAIFAFDPRLISNIPLSIVSNYSTSKPGEGASERKRRSWRWRAWVGTIGGMGSVDEVDTP